MEIKRQSGMTLIELIVVMVVAALLGIGLLLTWQSRQTNVHSTATRLLIDLRYVRNLAMTEKADYQVHLLSNECVNGECTAQYRLEDSDGNTVHFPSVDHHTIILDDQVNLTLQNLPNEKVVFRQDGSPHVDVNGTELVAPAVITLQWGDSSRELRIFPYTGVTIRTDHITVPQNPQP